MALEKNSTAMSLSRNHDPVTQNNPQTLLRAVPCRNYFLSCKPHPLTISPCRWNHSPTGWKASSTGCKRQWCLSWLSFNVSQLSGLILHSCAPRIVPNCSQQDLWVILINWVMISKKRHCCGALITRSHLVPKLCNSIKNLVGGWIALQVGEKNVYL